MYTGAQLVLEILHLFRSITHKTAKQYHCLQCRLSSHSTCLLVPFTLVAVKTVTHSRPLKVVPDMLITMHALVGETRRRRGRDRGHDADAKCFRGYAGSGRVFHCRDPKHALTAKECHGRLACRKPLCFKTLPRHLSAEKGRFSSVVCQSAAHFMPKALASARVCRA